ncbi:IPT/TIG domain protein [Caballeronia hypogeia]|uniref:IPT/TIG domain protein n=2 Tax=Caballeronia hypogeia TaxID=1777140 RepID=A0A158DJU5_9BURK|nr:IPT/TIG domain protein [Caballeronia hypogeia]
MLAATAGLTVNGFTPSVAVPGDTITITGSGFTKATRVVWRGGQFYLQVNSANEITFQVPTLGNGEDWSGTLMLLREDGAQVTTTTTLTVQALPLPTSLSATNAREGDEVRIDGKFLIPTLVKSLMMGDREFLPSRGNGTSLWFNVPKGAPSGSVVVLDWKGHKISAGTLNVIPPSPSIEFASVQLSQGPLFSVSDPVADPNLRLVSQRDLLVRVRLKPAASLGQINPDVEMAFMNEKKTWQAVRMQGPGALSTNAIAENDIANSYTYTIPAEWLDKGFRFQIRAADNRYPDATKIFSYQPPAAALGGGTYVRMHLVPVVTPNGAKGKIDVDFFKKALMAAYPLSAVDVVVEPEIKWATTAYSNDDILGLLYDINSRRASSQPNNYDFYYGVVPCGCTSVAFAPGRAGVIPDSGYYTKEGPMQVSIHEIGHSFGRMHTWDDEASPYKSGNAIGVGPWLPEVTADLAQSFINPATRYDIMSYNVPNDSVSAYTYAGVYKYVEQNLPLSARPKLLRASAPAGTALRLAGVLNENAGTVKLNAAMRVSGTPDTVVLAGDAQLANDDYVIELETGNGTYRYPLQPVKIVMEQVSSSLAGFELKIPVVDKIIRTRVLRGKAVLLDQPGMPSN